MPVGWALLVCSLTARVRVRPLLRGMLPHCHLSCTLSCRLASSLIILGFFFFVIVVPELKLEFPTWALVRPCSPWAPWHPPPTLAAHSALAGSPSPPLPALLPSSWHLPVPLPQVLISLTNDLSVMATSFDKVNWRPPLLSGHTLSRQTARAVAGKQAHIGAWSAVQVHSSDHPQTWHMTKSLALALAIAIVGAGSMILLFALANPANINWWHIFGIELEPETDPAIRTNGQASWQRAWLASRRAFLLHTGPGCVTLQAVVTPLSSPVCRLLLSCILG